MDPIPTVGTVRLTVPMAMVITTVDRSLDPLHVAKFQTATMRVDAEKVCKQ